ncbi:MAG: ATP-binding protein [Defluviicoccus sp.]|nr:ATP-binding protein [Defluviicoccus sp.]
MLERHAACCCVVALVDRLVHNAEIIAIDGDSYRRKEAEERQKQRGAPPAAAIRQERPDRPRDARAC